MIVLDSTSKSLEILLAGAVITNQLPAVGAYVDILDTDQSVSDIANFDTVTNSTTAVTLVSSPSSGHTRVIKSISISNIDTGAVTVTLRINNGGTFYIIAKVTLAVGDNLIVDSDD